MRHHTEQSDEAAADHPFQIELTGDDADRHQHHRMQPDQPHNYLMPACPDLRRDRPPLRQVVLDHERSPANRRPGYGRRDP
jgi:hypothetical protein